MPTIDNGQREVIAHFSPIKLILGWPVLLGTGAILFFWGRDVLLPQFEVVPESPADHVVDTFGNAVHLWGLLLGIVCLALLFWWAFKATRNVIVNGTDAIWIEQGRLICRGPRPLDIPIRDIKSAELASQFITNSAKTNFLRYEARYISIVLKDGTQARLDLGPYREIEDAIIAPITARIDRARH